MVQSSTRPKKSKPSTAQNKTGFELRFADYRFFEETAPERWKCSVCFSQQEPMTFNEAIEHEMLRLHFMSVESFRSWCPEFKVEWGPSNPFGISVPPTYGAPKESSWLSDDAAKFSIRFWIRQMEAAKEGVELRWDRFFEKLVEKKVSIWDEISMSDIYSDWPVGTINTGSEDDLGKWSSASSSVEPIGPSDRWADEPYVEPSKEDVPAIDIDPELLDIISQQGPISEERKMRLGKFNKMTTEEKIHKIQSLVHQLVILS